MPDADRIAGPEVLLAVLFPDPPDLSAAATAACSCLETRVRATWFEMPARPDDLFVSAEVMALFTAFAPVSCWSRLACWLNQFRSCCQNERDEMLTAPFSHAGHARNTR